MKELTIEEKAERYNEALVWMQDLYPTMEGAMKEDAEHYFPELKKSEDEKIKQEIITYLSTVDDKELIPYESWVAWLEKQGEYKSPEEVLKIRQELYQSGYNDGYKHGCEDSKKQDKQNLANSTKNCEDEQKPIEIEPKFHEGDWVVDKDGHIFKIMLINNDFNHITYACRPIEENSRDWTSYSENDIRLWDITEDAKAGDVLVTGGVIFIFNKIHGVWLNCHCSLHKDGSFNNGDYDLITDKYFSEVYPATKEQRDALMKAIVDAGYTFDFEKKELKKIEQEPTNYKKQLMNETTDLIKDYITQKPADRIESTSHNYITPNQQFFQWIYDRLINVHNEDPNVDYMLSLKERVEDMQKSAWSIEDEDMLDNIIDDYDDADEHNLVDDIGKVMWLKSIKERVGCEANRTTMWKPCEQDILLLERIANGKSNPQDFQASLGALIEQLKKL